MKLLRKIFRRKKITVITYAPMVRTVNHVTGHLYEVSTYKTPLG